MHLTLTLDRYWMHRLLLSIHQESSSRSRLPGIVDVTSLVPPHPNISTVTSSDPTAVQHASLRKGQTIYSLAVTVSSEGYQMAYWPGVAKRKDGTGTKYCSSPNGVDSLLAGLLLVPLGASYHR